MCSLSGGQNCIIYSLVSSHWSKITKIIKIIKIQFYKYEHMVVKFTFLNINQLDALNFIISLFQASTCFKHMCMVDIKKYIEMHVQQNIIMLLCFHVHLLVPSLFMYVFGTSTKFGSVWWFVFHHSRKNLPITNTVYWKIPKIRH